MLQMILKLIWDTVRSLVQPIGQLMRGMWSSIWLLVTGVFKVEPGEVKRPLIVLASLLVIAGSLISILCTEFRPRPKANRAPVRGVGAVSAEQVAALLNQRGRIVLWVSKHEGQDAPMSEASVQPFRDELQNYPEVQLVATEEQESQSMMMQPTATQTDAFFRALEKHATVEAIVSFVGVPWLPLDAYARLREPRPKLVLIDPTGMGTVTREMFEKGVVQLAILPRHTPPPDTGAPPRTPRDWFDRYLMVVTPANTADLLE